MPTTPGSAGQAGGQRALGGAGGSPVGHAAHGAPHGPAGTPAAPGRGKSAQRPTRRPRTAQHRGQRVGEGDAGAAVPAGRAAGEEQAQRRPVPAAPDHRAAVAAGAEGARPALRSRSGRRSGTPPSSYWTATPSTSTAVIRPWVCPVVRPTFSTGLVRVDVEAAGDRAGQRTAGEVARFGVHARRPASRRRRPPGSARSADQPLERGQAWPPGRRGVPPSAGRAAGRRRRARRRRSRPARGCWTGSRSPPPARTKPPSVPA